MGYSNLRHYIGGMADWQTNDGPLEKWNRSTAPLPSKSILEPSAPHRLSWLETIANFSLERLIVIWFGMIIVFGLIYWIAGLGMGMGLQSGNSVVKADGQGFVTAIYFSFVTALSIGYGDVVPLGWFRLAAII